MHDDTDPDPGSGSGSGSGSGFGSDSDSGSGFGFDADATTAVNPPDTSGLADGADGGAVDDSGADPHAGSGTPASARAAEPLAELETHSDAHAPPSDGSEARLDALLYAGERRRARLPTEHGALVATSHRVLAYAPDADPDERATLRDVHRVNVTDVTPASTSAGWLLRPTVYAVVVGLLLVVGGSMVSLDGMATAAPSGAGATGIGGMLSALTGLLSVLALLDDLLRVGGALSLLLGAALLGVYLLTRGREVTVHTEGELPDLSAPLGSDVDAADVESFRSEAGLEPPSDDGGLFSR